MNLKVEIEPDDVFFSEADAPERSTGWVDGFSFDRGEGEWSFFDAEANTLSRISALAELSEALSDLGLDEESCQEDSSDSKEYARDPYAYHGLTRSDFT